MLTLANSRILFDFEIVCLITLFIGLGVFGLFFGTFRKEKAPKGIGADFVWQDLLLVWMPLALFLLTPILGFLMGGQEPQEQTNQLSAQMMQLNVFMFVGLITWSMVCFFGHRNPFKVLGHKQQPLNNVLGFGLAGAAVAFIVCSMLIGYVSKTLLSEIFGELAEQKPVELMRQFKSNFGLLVLMIINACIAAPIVEELLFRGYFYGTIKRFTSPLFSALVTGGLFAVVHGNLASLLPLWVLAVFLCFAYEYTRSIWVPIAIHAVFNLVSVGLILFYPEPELESATGLLFLFNR